MLTPDEVTLVAFLKLYQYFFNFFVKKSAVFDMRSDSQIHIFYYLNVLAEYIGLLKKVYFIFFCLFYENVL